MTRTFAILLGLGALLAVASQAFAAGPCCCNYEDREITTYRTVCETAWRDVKIVRYRPQFETVQVEQRRMIPKPVVEMVTRDCTHVVMRPVTEMLSRDRCYVTYEAKTVEKTIHVDCGHWEAGACESNCSGCCAAPRVWCPKLVAKQISCTVMVPKMNRDTVQVPVCRLVPETVTRKVTMPVCHMTYEEQKCVVPVTRCKMVPYTCVERMPYTVTRQVPCKHIVRVPVCDTPPAL